MIYRKGISSEVLFFCCLASQTEVPQAKMSDLDKNSKEQ